MDSRTKHRIGLVTAVAAAAALAAGGTALGTPGSGVTGTAPIRGTAEEKIKTRGNQPYDVVVHTITIAPGGHSGWHTHPGQAIVLVKSGIFTVYDAKTCSPEVYRAGEVFVDRGYGDVHIARNNGTQPTELHVTYLDVPVGGAFRTDAADPGTCPS